MAAARDQAARIVRTGPETAGHEAAREAADIADSIRAHLSDETARRTTEVPDRPVTAKPVAPEVVAAPAAKAGKRKTIFFGVIAILALAAASYGVHWFLVGQIGRAHV